MTSLYDDLYSEIEDLKKQLYIAQQNRDIALSMVTEQLEINENLRNKIQSAFYTFILEDPYPKHTEWQMNQGLRSKLDKLFRVKFGKPPDPISIHQAWYDGFQFARALVMKNLK